MKVKEIVLALCKLESKKKQVNVAQMNEIVGQFAELLTEDSYGECFDTLKNLVTLGLKRRAKKAKKK